MTHLLSLFNYLAGTFTLSPLAWFPWKLGNLLLCDKGHVIFNDHSELN